MQTPEWIATETGGTGSARPPVSPRVGAPLARCVALPPWLAGPGTHPQRYLERREEVLGAGATWLKLWVSWRAAQGIVRPRSRAESWAQLDGGAGSGDRLLQLALLERDVALANADGLGVILAIHHDAPEWAGQAPPSGHPPGAIVPSDRSPDGAWAWFVEYLCERFSPRARLGDPSGSRPYVHALEICNEPNVRLWPQRDLGQAIAEMIVTADILASSHGGPPILAPASSDMPIVARRWSRLGIDSATFAKNLLYELRGWQPRGYVGWSHHNHRDVLTRSSTGVARLRNLLAALDWSGGDRWIWLTEGGFPTMEEERDGPWRAKARRLARSRLTVDNLERMGTLLDVPLWTKMLDEYGWLATPSP